MLINLRNAMMAGKRLPYDAEVEYLESSGTQYINTLCKIVPRATKFEFTFSVSSYGGKSFLFGARNDTVVTSEYNCTAYRSGANLRKDWAKTSADFSTTLSVNKIYTYTAQNVTISLNDETFVGTGNKSNTRLSYDFLLFTVNTAGSVDSCMFAGRLYSAKLWEGDALIFDGIPVRKGTVGYLYDRVSGKLFGNAGTGDFVLGPDIVPVEYIESHGTEWIDTGFKITNATSFAYDVKFTLATTITKTEPRVFSNEGAGSGAYYDIYLLTSTNILSIRQSGTTAQISRRDVPIIATMDEYGVYRGYYEDTPQTLLYEATRAFVAPTTDRDYRIFSRGNNTSSQFLWQGKLYWLNFTKNGEPSRRYRPVRVGTDATSWEGAIMDVLTRRIYRNAGTGAFAYGNDLKYPIPAS